MRPCPYTIDSVMIHRPPMLLLDEVIEYNDNEIVAGATIRHDSTFITPHGVPGHAAIEYMAQACGAYAGVIALEGGLPVRMGFLIGTRLCKVRVPWFRLGDKLSISAAIVLHDEQLAAFDCRIEIDGRVVADAQLKVYQPDGDFLQANER